MSGSSDDEKEIKVEKLQFLTKSVSLAVGEIATVKINIEPVSVKDKANIVYATDQKEVISLSNQTADGVVVTAMKPGTSVIIVEAGGLRDYCEIEVKGNTSIKDPYIIISQPTFETRIDSRKTITASLYGGIESDNSSFVWNIEQESPVYKLDTAGNTAVVTCIGSGMAKITVSHPKAKYSVDTIGFGLQNNEEATYITTRQNVITMDKQGENIPLEVSLVGGKEEDKNNFFFSIVSGADYISISKTLNYCYITAKNEGIAIIQVEHPKSKSTLKIQVIVSQYITSNYMEVDNSFVVLSGNEGRMITASIIGETESTAYANFTYEVTDPTVVHIEQINNSFYATGIKTGSSKLIIKNPAVAYNREVLIIVEDQVLSLNEKYITTSQNIVQLEVGGSPYRLNMTLVGGTQADKNSFSWLVENSNVIEVDSADGSVSYTRSALIVDTYTTEALITPKTAGTTKITLQHPKAITGTTVIVKVYPKGTFNTAPISLYSPQSLIKIPIGTTVNHTIQVNNLNAGIGVLTWNIENTAIATAVGNGLEGAISGNTTGYTALNVTGDLITYPYNATVIVGSTEYLANEKIIYIDSHFKNITAKQIAYIQVQSNNDLLKGSNGFNVVNDNTDAVYARFANDVLIVQGINPGQAELTISNGQATNTITLLVNVEQGNVTIDYPYYFTSPEFVGIVINETKPITVNLKDAPVAEQQKISWTIDDIGVVSGIGNGQVFQATAKKVGQTIVTAKHPKVYEPKQIVVYTANTQAELDSQFVMYTEKKNYLVSKGEKFFVKIDTNGTESQNAMMNWAVDDISVINIDAVGNGAYITALESGNAVITVSHSGSSLPCKLYISVKDLLTDSGNKDILVHSVIEMVKNTNKALSPSYYGMSEYEKENTRWAIEDATIATVGPKGKDGYIYARSAGQTFITVSNESVNYSKKVLLVVVNSEDDLGKTVLLTFDEGYKKVTPEEIFKLTLVTGQAGFPENELVNIQWNVTANNVLEITPQGKTVAVKAKNEGIATITATHPLCVKPATINIEVKKEGGIIVPEAYTVSVDKIKGIVVGQNETITANFFNYQGQPITTTLHSTVWTVEDPTVVSISGNGNVCMMQALKKGQTYVTLSHPKVVDPVKILVYTANTAGELSVMWPLATDKQNYLINEGEEATLKIHTLDDNQDKINQIKWSVENSSILSYSIVSKKEIKITGRAVGNTKVTVTHENADPVVFYISVKSLETAESSIKITTECIIGMVKGSSRNTTIQTNLPEVDKQSLSWSTDNAGIVTVVGNGENATIEAIQTGETFITVSIGSTKRKILVYVCNTEDEVQAYCAMNIDKQYYQIGIGETINLSMYYAPNYPSSINNTTYTDVYQNNVVNIEVVGGKGLINGVNEGLATIKVVNTDCRTPIYITIEVSERYNGNISDPIENKYITITKTIYTLFIEDMTTPANVIINGIGLSDIELGQTQWTIKDNNICQINASGKEAYIYPKGKGTTTIEVDNPLAKNNIILTIVVKSKTDENINTPYIKVDNPVITVSKGGNKTFTATVQNVSNPDYTAFGYELDTQDYIKVSRAGNLFTITAKMAGQTLLTLSHPQSSYTTKVIIIVEPTLDDNVVFLTTTDNYVSLIKGNEKSIQVELKNYEDYDPENYTWEIQDPSIASIQGLGITGIIEGKNIGATKITVTHKYAPYSLEIGVRIVSNITSNPIYITTKGNIVSVENGESIGASVQLKNGNEAEYSLFSWQTSNTDIIELISSGEQAKIKGLKPGTATIQIVHPSSLNSITIIVMVEPKPEETGIYITTDSVMIQMKPTDASKQVNVRLVGGNAEDIYGFTWKIVNYESLIKFADGTSKPVIDIVSNADVSYIVPKNEGTAIIQVTHAKTAYKLNMTVNVQLFNSIKFSQSNIQIEQGLSNVVSVETPSGQLIVYETNTPDIVSVTGTNKTCIIEALKEGVAVITARTLSGSSYDELLVKVNPSPQGETKYIKLSTNLLNLITTQQAVVISGELVGSTFNEEDNEDTIWESENTNIVTVYGTGKSCSVTPKGVGETTIKVTNSNIPNYVKRMYIRVTASDIIYTISDALVIMEIGDNKTISVKMSNSSDIDYTNNMVWLNADTEIINIVPSGNKSSCVLFAKKAGETTVTALYGNTPKLCTVIVKEPKNFSIPTRVDVCPGEEVEVEYTISPVDQTITYSVDSLSYIELFHDEVNKKFRIKGKPSQGFTVIQIVANNMPYTCTVNTVKNHYLSFANASIRMKPNENKTIAYEVNPIKTEVQPHYDTTKSTLVIDNEAQTLTIQPKKAGYDLLKFYSVATGITVNLPLYMYYPNLPIGFTYSANINPNYPRTYYVKSRVDEEQSAVMLADGEQVYIRLKINNSLYPNHGVTITDVKITSSAHQCPFSITPEVSDPSSIVITSTSATHFGYYPEYIQATHFIGTLDIHYEVPEGASVPSKKVKKYMLYGEEWKRN